MSVELACTCSGLPAHSHIFRPEPRLSDGVRVMVPVDTGEVRIWIDWKEVARAYATGRTEDAALRQ